MKNDFKKALLLNNIGNVTNLRLGVMFWRKKDGIASLLLSALEDFGCVLTSFLHNEKLSKNLDVVLAYGPLGSLTPLANQILACTPSRRPLFVLLMTEQLPNPDLPELIRYTGGIIRSRMERLAYRKVDQRDWHLDPRLYWITKKLHRFRYYGDLYWLQSEGILSVLAIGSQWTVDFLRLRGFDPIVTYYGYYPDLGEDLGIKRTIPVLWIGKIGTDRRRKILRQVRADLKDRGVEILVIDGVENPYIFGEERTILLNRTKIVINILRQKWDNHSIRYYLASSNRALIVTEPTYPHLPFLPGEHLVEAQVNQMADKIIYYLAHEEERQQIIDRAYQLVTSELTLEKAMHNILKRVAHIRRGHL